MEDPTKVISGVRYTFAEFREKCRRTFEGSLSDLAVVAAWDKGELPSRVGGHSNVRNKIEGTASTNDSHGINQGNAQASFKDKVIPKDPRDLEKLEKKVKEIHKIERTQELDNMKKESQEKEEKKKRAALEIRKLEKEKEKDEDEGEEKAPTYSKDVAFTKAFNIWKTTPGRGKMIWEGAEKLKGGEKTRETGNISKWFKQAFNKKFSAKDIAVSEVQTWARSGVITAYDTNKNY